MARARRWIGFAVGALAVAIVGVAGGLVVAKRVTTGSWSLPEVRDLIRFERALRGEPPPPPAPPRVIYLHRAAITLTGGEDDAIRRISSVVGAGPHRHDESAGAGGDDAPHALDTSRVVSLRGFRGSNATWRKIVACVKDQFAPFDVEVTDREPAPETAYVLAAVGGKPTDLGQPRRVTGLAPFNGEVVPGAVVFAFADALGNRPRAVCEVLAMEIAHAYGLDHEHHCKDVMTYLQGCGAKRFVDVDARCGEAEARDCADGAPTQNSYRRLLDVLGPRRAPAPVSTR